MIPTIATSTIQLPVRFAGFFSGGGFFPFGMLRTAGLAADANQMPTKMSGVGEVCGVESEVVVLLDVLSKPVPPVRLGAVT